MVPAVTSQADGCGSSKSQVQAQVLFLSETKIDRSYPNLGGGGGGCYSVTPHMQAHLRVNPHCFGRRQPDDSSSSGLRERVVFLAPSVLWSLPQ